MGAASEVFSSCSRNQRSHGIPSLRLGSQHEALSQTWPCTGRRDLLALALQATPGVQPDLAEVWKARPWGDISADFQESSAGQSYSPTCWWHKWGLAASGARCSRVLPVTHGCLRSILQLVMQYLYYGGPESLLIKNNEIMEVRTCRAGSARKSWAEGRPWSAVAGTGSAEMEALGGASER